MRVLVTGAGGMLARAVIVHCQTYDDSVLPYDRASLDISDDEQVQRVIRDEGPDIVINCAAWTDVDGCESDHERAEAVNARGPENLARACRSAGSGFITISTDYVFDGEKDGFYTQRDDPNPQSIYAHSKLEGERRSQAAYARTIVVRSGFIFGPGGRNFLSTIVDRAERGERLAAIVDATGTPTYAFDLAAQLRQLALLDLPGIYHVVNSGAGATYAEVVRFAIAAAGIRSEVVGVAADSIKRPAARPKNSRLACLISGRIGLPELPSWQAGMREFVQKRTPHTLGVSDQLP